ncbi:MAG: hypothetical protein J3K34DRAFT_77531 [Monoraphidium minutum]|nr:MAG: hypothetical protein J3K34DRAFT_77531 [Monoraphidium minutum]
MLPSRLALLLALAAAEVARVSANGIPVCAPGTQTHGLCLARALPALHQQLRQRRPLLQHRHDVRRQHVHAGRRRSGAAGAAAHAAAAGDGEYGDQHVSGAAQHKDQRHGRQPHHARRGAGVGQAELPSVYERRGSGAGPHGRGEAPGRGLGAAGRGCAGGLWAAGGVTGARQAPGPDTVARGTAARACEHAARLRRHAHLAGFRSHWPALTAPGPACHAQVGVLLLLALFF